MKKIGIDWQQFVDAWKLGEVKSIKDFTDQISALLKNGEAKLLANPTIISVADEEANIKVGDKIPYTIPIDYSSTKSGWQLQYLDCGLNLKIKGKIVSGNIIQAQIFSNISNIKQWKATQGGDYPVLSNREVSIFCQINNKETIILGGLTNSSQQKNISTFPIISNLPFIGDFFKIETTETEDTEIVFLLTPEIKKL